MFVALRWALAIAGQSCASRRVLRRSLIRVWRVHLKCMWLPYGRLASGVRLRCSGEGDASGGTPRAVYRRSPRFRNFQFFGGRRLLFVVHAQSLALGCIVVQGCLLSCPPRHLMFTRVTVLLDVVPSSTLWLWFANACAPSMASSSGCRSECMGASDAAPRCRGGVICAARRVTPSARSS